ncbi:hypothetical protein M0813_27225 [Anaeramoeba flamelloides]|uniref:Uncharacterized protein n=1 Tax=Anaeramoeba flamelloides TaxID=1746091 RepID=A0ABQ8XYP6_9EUKA|nr:hypothetical protein M0813_27225 [Anaeramoeba flamelloides]
MQTHGQMLKVMCQRVKNFLPLFTDSTYCSTCVVFVASEFLEQTIPHERETIVTFSKTRHLKPVIKCLMKKLEIIKQNSKKKLFLIKLQMNIFKVTSILERIQNKLTEEFKSNELKLIQHLDYDQQKLSGLLTKITLLAGEIPKVYQIPIVNVVRQGIWNWIDYHPEQFTEFYRSGKKMQGNPEILFQKILDWSTSAKKKVQYQYWPLLTMLLVLCPKIILQIGTNDKKVLKSATGKFVENLKKIFKGKDQKKVQTSARCLIDFCKAATYVAKSDQTGLRLMVPKIQELIAPKLLNQKKMIITDVELLVDFLVSSFRLTPTETTKEHYNACLHPNSAPIFKLMLIKSLVQIAQETPLEWNPSIEKTYSRAVDVKQIFYEYLDSLRRLHTNQLSLGKTGSLKSLTNNSNIKKKKENKWN